MQNQEVQLSENEQIIQRKSKLAPLAEANQASYAASSNFQVENLIEEVAKKFADVPKESMPEKEAAPRYKIAGRVMTMRIMGKAAFAHIDDGSARMQIYVRQEDVGEEGYQAFKKLYDLGDIVFIEGFPFRTKTGELTIHTEKIRLITKCLRPLPEKFHGLTDVEIRYRKRYLDLAVNPAVRDTFTKRAHIIRFIRRFFDERKYLEVETPMMHALAGGATAKPFTTHHNALNMDLYMRIAPELHLKRLLVGGFNRVYEVNRNFRNEGISTLHNPEFTMIEFYQAYASLENLISLTEELLSLLAKEVLGTAEITYQGANISLAPPFKRLTILESVSEWCGFEGDEFILKKVTAEIAPILLKSIADALPEEKKLAEGVSVEQALAFAKATLSSDEMRLLGGKLMYNFFEEYVEKTLIQPTFVLDFPLAVSPLARKNDKKPWFVDRFELFIAGREIANAFNELNDPADQAERFAAQLRAKKRGDDEAMDFDNDYIEALEYGMPCAAGEGIGIDRLVMLLTDSPSIRDVILFPLLRPQAE